MSDDRLHAAALELAWEIRSLPPHVRPRVRRPLYDLLRTARELRDEHESLRTQAAVLRSLLRRRISDE